MKFFPLLLILTTVLLYSCTDDKRQPNNPNDLTYHTANITSGALNVEPVLTGNIEQKELSAQFKFSNTESADLEIKEITISTAEGLHSSPITSFTPFLLQEGKDTSFTLRFNPFNDYKLYQITGMQGNFRPDYNINILYRAVNSSKELTLSLKAIPKKSDYLSYSKRHATPLVGYSFNTKISFDDRQKKYLETLKVVPSPPFVFLSNQEIAVCGLNFRLKDYYMKDTLHAELLIVNHADFQVNIVPGALDITDENKLSTEEPKTVGVEKVSGTQQNPNMIEKGDRVLIHFKKHMKLNGHKYLLFHINKAFMLKGNKSLFTENVQLIPVTFK